MAMYGYARVSTTDQDLELQKERPEGCRLRDCAFREGQRGRAARAGRNSTRSLISSARETLW